MVNRRWLLLFLPCASALVISFSAAPQELPGTRASLTAPCNAFSTEAGRFTRMTTVHDTPCGTIVPWRCGSGHSGRHGGGI